VTEDIAGPWDTNVVGLCAGLFAATAVASAPSLSKLVPIAVQIVLMAFRTGAHVAAMADRIYQTVDISESWTFVVPSIGDSEARVLIDNFNNEKVRKTYFQELYRGLMV
jgi:hypothetical protein